MFTINKERNVDYYNTYSNVDTTTEVDIDQSIILCNLCSSGWFVQTHAVTQYYCELLVLTVVVIISVSVEQQVFSL